MDLSSLTPENTLKYDKEKSWIYVIGSINGDMKVLETVIEEIESAYTLASNDKIIFLGNYIGEEGNARDIFDTLFKYQMRRKEQVILLRGQAEQRMIYSRKSFFLSGLGQNTLKAYKHDKSIPFSLERDNRFNVKSFVADRNWLHTMPAFYASKRFYFVNQGVNPEVDLAKQDPNSLMFLGDVFYQSKVKFDKKVVHSRKLNKVEIKENRIGIMDSNKEVVHYSILNDSKGSDVEELVNIKRSCLIG